MKIVINRDYGGFGLSRQAIDQYCNAYGIVPGEWNDTYGYYSEFSDRDIDRSDPVLVSIVESMGPKANGPFALLRVVQVPDDVKYTIEEYDGLEHVAEVHRTWPSR